MVLRKQTSYSGLWSTTIEFEPTDTSSEAGIIATYSKWSFIAMLVRRGVDKALQLVLQWTDPDTFEVTVRDCKVSVLQLTLQEEHIVGFETPSIMLGIRARPDTYTVLFREVTRCEWVEVKTFPSQVVSHEKRPHDRPFTGAHFGLFAQGTNGAGALTPAYFQYAEFNSAL